MQLLGARVLADFLAELEHAFQALLQILVDAVGAAERAPARTAPQGSARLRAALRTNAAMPHGARRRTRCQVVARPCALCAGAARRRARRCSRARQLARRRGNSRCRRRGRERRRARAGEGRSPCGTASLRSAACGEQPQRDAQPARCDPHLIARLRPGGGALLAGCRASNASNSRRDTRMQIRSWDRSGAAISFASDAERRSVALPAGDLVGDCARVRSDARRRPLLAVAVLASERCSRSRTRDGSRSATTVETGARRARNCVTLVEQRWAKRRAATK